MQKQFLGSECSFQSIIQSTINQLGIGKGNVKVTMPFHKEFYNALKFFMIISGPESVRNIMLIAQCKKSF